MQHNCHLHRRGAARGPSNAVRVVNKSQSEKVETAYVVHPRIFLIELLLTLVLGIPLKLHRYDVHSFVNLPDDAEPLQLRRQWFLPTLIV